MSARTRQLVGLSVVVAEYWIVPLAALRDALRTPYDFELGRFLASVTSSLRQDWWSAPLFAWPLAPALLVAAALAAKRLRGTWPRPPSEITADKLTVALALPIIGELLFFGGLIALIFGPCVLGFRDTCLNIVM
jgi:hypothetical protein